MASADYANLKSFYALMTEGNNGANRFRVAHFQRPYVWPERFVWQLLEDLWDLYKSQRPSKPIGCVITNDAAGTHEIVDGQQRLITLTLIHRAIVFWCRRHEAGSLPYFMGSLFDSNHPNPLFKTRDLASTHGCVWLPRLMLFDVDESAWFHQVFLSHPVDTEEHINFALQAGDVPQQRLPFINNFKTILSFLADRKGGASCQGALSKGGNPMSLETMEFQHAVRGANASSPGFYMKHQFDKDHGRLNSIDELDGFCSYISQNTKIVHFVTYDPGMAVDIFNALNRPGLPLATPQRLKASLLAHVDYWTVDSASSVWNEAERKMMVLVGWDNEPLTPLLRCLLEMAPKPPSNMSADFFYENPACRGKFRESSRLTMLEQFEDFCVEVRDGGAPPAPPSRRHRLYGKTGQANTEAVAHFVETYLGGPMVSLYISLVSLNDPNSWGEGPYLSEGGAFSDAARARIQNSISMLKHVHHLDLDRDWVCVALLASHLWGFAETSACGPEVVEAFFERFETFVAYMIFCRPINRPRNKKNPTFNAKVWAWPDTKMREDRMGYYREVMELLYQEPLAVVAQWLELSHAEKRRMHTILQPDGSHFVGNVDKTLRKKVKTYMLLKAETMLCGEGSQPDEVMSSFDSIARGLLDQSSSSSVDTFRQIRLTAIVPRYPGHSSDWYTFGWKQQEIEQYRDCPPIGNLALTLHGDPIYDNHSFDKFSSDVKRLPGAYGFCTTVGLLNISGSFSKADLHRRNTVLYQLLLKGWKLIEASEDIGLAAQLSSFGQPKGDVPLRPAPKSAVCFARTAKGGADTDLDRLLGGGALAPTFVVGCVVALVGLKSNSWRNGQAGKVVSVNGNRCEVDLEENGVRKRLSLKADNLKILSTGPRVVAPPTQRPSRLDPNLKTSLCSGYMAGMECGYVSCRHAHSVEEWRCYHFAMGGCVPSCTGLVRDCLATYSRRKWFRHVGSAAAEPPSKRARHSGPGPSSSTSSSAAAPAGAAGAAGMGCGGACCGCVGCAGSGVGSSSGVLRLRHGP